MINFGAVPAGSVLPIPFTTYGKTNGESITLTGLAVTDIEVYKGTSMTQRASDAGYALMDTDGIDIDSVTGFHGFSIDLGDNTDAGFYAAGSFYTVLVSSITVDGQTVNFIAATFRIVAAESVSGKPKVDVDAFGGSAGTFASGRPEVNTSHVAGTAQTAGDIIGDTNDIQTRLPAALVSGRMDASVGAMAANTLTASAVAADAVTELQSGLSTHSAADVWAVATRALTDKAGFSLSAAGVQAIWDALTSALTTAGSIGKLIVDNLNATISSRLATAGYTAPLDAAGVRSAVGLAAANLDSQLSGIGSKTTNLPSDPADQSLIIDATNAIMNRLGTPAGASMSADVAAVPGAVLAAAAADPIAANVEEVNNVALQGNGTAGNAWRPA